jgi:hypothetical protein
MFIDWTKLQIISTAPSKSTNNGTLHLPKQGPESTEKISCFDFKPFYSLKRLFSSVTSDYVSYLTSAIGL